MIVIYKSRWNSRLTAVQSMYAIYSTAINERAAIIRRISHVLHSRELQFLSFSSHLRVTTGHTYLLIYITRRNSIHKLMWEIKRFESFENFIKFCCIFIYFDIIKKCYSEELIWKKSFFFVIQDDVSMYTSESNINITY